VYPAGTRADSTLPAQSPISTCHVFSFVSWKSSQKRRRNPGNAPFFLFKTPGKYTRNMQQKMRTITVTTSLKTQAVCQRVVTLKRRVVAR
jgi:hypothetical protein